MTTTTSSRPPPPPSKSFFDVDVTIVSAKHLKNVNWRYGDLKPYAIVYLLTSDTDTTATETDSDKKLRFATKPDDSGSTRPVWNEKFVFPVPGDLLDWSVLSIEIFHSKPSETPKPLVGTVRCGLKDLIGGGTDQKSIQPIRTLELRRPSGRPQGKVRVKFSVQERIPPPSAPAPLLTRPSPDYNLHHHPPPSPYYYSNTPPTPALRDYRTYSAPPPSPPAQRSYSNRAPSPPPPTTSSYQYGNYTDPYYGGYYSSCPSYNYSAPPAQPATGLMSVPPPPSYYDRVSYGGGPSAPVDCSAYDQTGRTARMGLGAGLAIGAVAGALGGIALEEGLKYEENKFTESDNLAGDNRSDYRADY